MAPWNSPAPSPKRTGIAAIFIDDKDKEAPRDAPLRRISNAAAGALDHAVFLVMLWTAAVVARQLIRGGEVHVLKHAPKVAMFATAYFIIDVAVALYWPEMTENLVQAGMFHIATVMFACLPETSV